MRSNAAGSLVIALFALGCGGQATMPTAPAPVTPAPIVLGGQSNAVYLAPQLKLAYPYGVMTAAESGQPIEQWAEGMPLWQQLAADLQKPIRAFVWWQGESNSMKVPTGSTDYASLLPAFMKRVRAIIPSVPIVVVRVLPTPGLENVRAAQEAYVRSDPHAILLSVDDIISTDGLHLTDGVSAYDTAAARVLAALR